MKRFLVLTLSSLILISNIVTYAEPLNTLKLDDVLSKVENNKNIKALDYKLKGLKITYDKLEDMVSMIPTGLVNMVRAQLSQPASVGSPVTVYIFGQPYTFDHTLTEGEITQVLANFGVPYTKNDKMAQDKLVFLTPKFTLSGYNVLAKNKEVALNSIKLGAEQLFYGLIVFDKSVELQKELTDVSLQQYENAKQKFDKGTISQNDLDIAKATYVQNKLKLDIQTRTRQNMLYRLNNLIGVPLNTDYGKVEGNIEISDMPKIDEDKAIEKALTNRAEIYAAEEDVKNNEEEMMFTKMNYLPEDSGYIMENIKLEKSKENLEIAKEDITYEIQLAYDKINKLYDDVEKAKLELDNAKTKYSSTKAQYDQGFITEDLLNLSHVAVTGAELKLISAINTYNSAIKKFQYAIASGPKFE